MKPASLAVCIGILVMAACAPEPKKAKYTVDEYLSDRVLMKKTVDDCANNPGELQNDPDCVNAISAARQDAYGSLRDRPGVLNAAGPK